MKLTNLLIYIFCLSSINVSCVKAQSNDRNYILSITPFQGVTNTSSLTDANSNTTIQYFDGLGRPVQTVQKAITSGAKDLISLTEYDQFGRDAVKWLPVPANVNTGAYTTPSDFTSLWNTQYGSSERPYATTEYEPSPLNRVTAQDGPGADWYSSNKKKSITYTTNASNNVKQYSVNSTQLVCGGYYDAATLYGQRTTDEDNKWVEEYTDKLGRKVLSRTYDSTYGNHDTYYVYDDLDNLRYVLPPSAADNINSTSDCGEATGTPLDLYGYIYHYDGRKRCIEKKLPGCAWIYMVYDLADRLTASQDGNQHTKGQWTVNRYDQFNRLVYSFIATNSQAEITSAFGGMPVNETLNGNATTGGYTLTGSASLTAMLSVNYYDNYNFLSGLASTLGYQVLSGYDKAYPETATDASSLNAKGLLTGTRVYHLDNPALFEVSALYYDKYGRVVQIRASNHLGGYDITYNLLDFTGKPTATLKTHGISGASDTYKEYYTYTYDKAQRLLTTSLSLNGGTAVKLADKTYDALGQLVKKMRHNNTEECDYTYNIRNWPTKMTSGSFVENLYYNTNLPSGVLPCYNGNIAYSNWTYNGVIKGYQYSYDGLNRLTTATFKHETSTHADGDYNETYSFDKMGNVTALTRKKDGSLIDNLDMSSYKGNQLRSVTDNAGSRYNYNIKEYQDLANKVDEFYYDANGNMRIDWDRNIATIRYNVLNLPEVIQFRNGNQIKNSYDAAGKKLGEEYFTQLTTLPVPIDTGAVRNVSYAASVIDQSGYAYVGNYEYNTSHGDVALTTLGRIYNDEGYIENPTSPQYYYYRRDHLSDNREVWLANTNTVVQRTQYYPSGLPWAYNAGDNPGLQRKKYNNKAFVEMHGYDTYDIEWRQYYPGIMKFQTPDPEIEDAYDLSPYTMCSDNMANRIDPDGRSDFWDYVPIVGSGRDIYQGIKNGDYTQMGIGVIGMVIDIGTGGEGSVAKGFIKSELKELIKGAAEKEVKQVAKTATESETKKVAKTTVEPLSNRVKLQNNTKETIKNNAPKTKDGRFIDPNTRKPIEKGKEVYGHKTGKEWSKYKKDPANQGKTRKEVIKDQNDPNIYQIEDKKSNASHKYEEKR
jgi:hypothetical protein